MFKDAYEIEPLKMVVLDAQGFEEEGRIEDAKIRFGDPPAMDPMQERVSVLGLKKIQQLIV